MVESGAIPDEDALPSEPPHEQLMEASPGAQYVAGNGQSESSPDVAVAGMSGPRAP